MATGRQMPIGEQSFQEVRKWKYVYVDKTEYIYQLLSGKFYFLSRPRRFGKSLLLSTLEAYFLGKQELFKGLYLEHAELELAAAQEREVWLKYPVLYLTLNEERFVSEFELNNTLNVALTEWEKLYGAEPAEQTLPSRFRGVIRRAYEKMGQQVVVLIDEYDKPLLDTLHRPDLHQTYKEILHAFYSVLKGQNSLPPFCLPYRRDAL